MLRCDLTLCQKLCTTRFLADHGDATAECSEHQNEKTRGLSVSGYLQDMVDEMKQAAAAEETPNG